ncbi:MAG: type VI secretion system baseplate subunit TssK [Planctomycetota bacterium]
MTTEIHWHEGLFLQPHHLQLLQRSMLERFGVERSLTSPYGWGVVDSKLSTDELEAGRVRFDVLKAVMPSGVVVDVPGGADLPAIDISSAFGSSTTPLTVALGVPLYYPTRANSLSIGETDWRIKRRFRVDEHDAMDENTGDNSQTVLVRRVNARLLVLEHDDRSDLEVLPLLRVVRATGEDTGLPRLERSFVPACYSIGGSAALKEQLRELANRVEAARAETVVQLTRAGFSIENFKGVQVQQMMRLSILNRACGRLPSLLAAPSGVAPFDMYLELRGLLGELAALQPDRDAWGASKYDHENPGPVFDELCESISDLLRAEGTATWMKVPFAARDEGLMVVSLSDEHLTRPSEYYLGIKTSLDPRELAKLVEDSAKFRLMAESMAAARVRGVPLEEERHPPLQLPSQVGLHYFRLRRGDAGRMWETIASERSMAVSFTGAEPGSIEEAALYMTVPG